MKNSHFILYSLVFGSMFLASIAHSQAEVPKTKTYRHEAFQMIVPADVAVAQKEVADFDVMSLTLSKTLLLSAYVGGHPNFPSDDTPRNKIATHFKINGLDAKFLRWQDEKGRYCGETLVTIHQGWADVVHFYYRNLSQPNAAQAEKMIRSVRLKGKTISKSDKETFVPVN